jgi:serine phosphatase RsbU (regulator of sigma subunit)/signal transduction histidine kinase
MKVFIRYTFYLLLILPFFVSANDDKNILLAEKGTLDLREWDFEKNGTVKLDGEWEFYWNKIYSPNAFGNIIIKTAKVPELWNKIEIDGESLGGQGFATYRLRILKTDNHTQYGLKIGRIETAYNLYIDGKLAIKRGQIGVKKELTNAQWLPAVHFFNTEKDTIDIVVQSSNFHHRKGGISQSITLGTPSQISKKETKALSIDYFLLGVLLIMALYHFALFVLRRDEPSTLYFALVCVFVSLHIIANGEFILSRLIEKINWELLVKLNYFGNYSRVIFFILFLGTLFRKEISKRFVQISTGLIAVQLLLVLFTKAVFYSQTLFAFLIVTLIAIIYMIYGLFKAAIKSKKREAIYSLVGTFILFVTGINDVLHDNLIINTTYLVPAGIFVFIFLQAFMLSFKSSSAFASLERLSKRLLSLDKIKNEFISNTSNDLGHPLNAIRDNVGAETGYLILSHEDKWLIKAKSTDEGVAKEASLNISIDEKYKNIKDYIVPSGLINQVIDSKEGVIISSPKDYNSWEKDIYIENQKPQSLLCIPLIYQNRTKGILYLENRKEQNVFNSERQNIIDLLSPQLAILIENAEIFWELESLNKNLEQKVIERTQEIIQQKEEIEAINDELEGQNQILDQTNMQLAAKNREITDSINYAEHIQKAILPPEKFVKEIIPESFIFFQPRDILSGDFYWIGKFGMSSGSHMLKGATPEYVIAAAVDCTGHGVPGALLSITGYNLLNNIINDFKNTKPSEILNILEKGITSYLRQEDGEIKSRDGMDIALISYEKNSKVLQYAGARNPLYLIRDNEVQVFKASRQSIGGLYYLKKKRKLIEYENHEIKIKEGDIIYMFSDGYADQFGGPDTKKFGYKPFRELLLSIHEKDMEEQKILLKESFDQWKGEKTQIDDIVIIGIRF